MSFTSGARSPTCFKSSPSGTCLEGALGSALQSVIVPTPDDAARSPLAQGA